MHAEAKEKAEAEAKLKAEQEAKQKAEQEAKAKQEAEQEVKEKAEAERQAKAQQKAAADKEAAEKAEQARKEAAAKEEAAAQQKKEEEAKAAKAKAEDAPSSPSKAPPGPTSATSSSAPSAKQKRKDMMKRAEEKDTAAGYEDPFQPKQPAAAQPSTPAAGPQPPATQAESSGWCAPAFPLTLAHSCPGPTHAHTLLLHLAYMLQAPQSASMSICSRTVCGFLTGILLIGKAASLKLGTLWFLGKTWHDQMHQSCRHLYCVSMFSMLFSLFLYSGNESERPKMLYRSASDEADDDDWEQTADRTPRGPNPPQGSAQASTSGRKAYTLDWMLRQQDQPECQSLPSHFEAADLMALGWRSQMGPMQVAPPAPVPCHLLLLPPTSSVNSASSSSLSRLFCSNKQAAKQTGYVGFYCRPGHPVGR